MKKNDDDVDSDFNHHDIMAKDIGIFVYIKRMLWDMYVWEGKIKIFRVRASQLIFLRE